MDVKTYMSLSLISQPNLRFPVHHCQCLVLSMISKLGSLIMVEYQSAPVAVSAKAGEQLPSIFGRESTHRTVRRHLFQYSQDLSIISSKVKGECEGLPSCETFRPAEHLHVDPVLDTWCQLEDSNRIN